MNPFVKQVLTSIVRYGLVWLAAKFGATLSNEELSELVTYVVPLLLLAWSLWQTRYGRQKLLTAQAMGRGIGRGVTEHEVEAEVRAGNSPAVSTLKTEVPV